MHNLLVNGVQKLTFAIISPAKSKTCGAIFAWMFLLLNAGQLFHFLLILLSLFPILLRSFH
ncbi:hydrolase [Enterococcus faecium]|nr:hydrolase [Enterococcus faecium]